MRFTKALMLVLVGITSGCAAPTLTYYSNGAYEEPAYNVPNLLREYFTETAAQKIEHCPVTFVHGEMGVWKFPFTFRKVMGNFTCSDEIDPKDPSIRIVKSDENNIRFYDNEVFVHEFLHAYYVLVFTPEERAAWIQFWKNEQSHLPYSFVMIAINLKITNEMLDSPVEGWAYMGGYIAFHQTWEVTPSVFINRYRGILKDEFLDPKPQPTEQAESEVK